MSRKKLFDLFVAVAALTLALVIAITFFSGASLKSVMVGFSLFTIYVLIIAAYLSRVALVFFGVFAVYKILQERAKASHSSR